MEELKQKIIAESYIHSDSKIRVNSFLGHQTDPILVDKMADEWISRFKNCNITKVLTVEVSGIALAYAVARKLNVPLVIAKKYDTGNVSDSEYSTKVISYVHFRRYDVIVEKKFLSKEDHVLIIDDILSNGCALVGLLGIIKQSGATVEGIGIALEKSFERGKKIIKKEGLRLESLVVVDNITPDGHIEFAD